MKLWKYEHHTEPLLETGPFFRRLIGHGVLAAGLLLFALVAGTCGYHWLGGLAWIDALYNASMILGGMGPVDTLSSPESKLFASIYAIVAGVLLLAITSVLIVPLVHRVLHALHLATPGEEEESEKGA